MAKKYTWTPSLSYTIMTGCISLFIACVFGAAASLIIYVSNIPMAKNFPYFVCVLIWIIVWVLMLCVPEDTEI